MAENYEAGRSLSPRAAEAWREALEPWFDGARVAAAVDVGSGTGRFAVRLASWFGVRVIGLEPARRMRQAAGACGHPLVGWVGGRGEELPFRSRSFDLAWLSNVFHHVRGRENCARELRRVLRPGGRVLIRGAFPGRTQHITLFDYFPEAREVLDEFPALDDTLGLFDAAGFSVEALQPVTQETCSSLRELADRTRTRADTTLDLLSDEEFACGQAALERAAAAEKAPSPVIDVLDLLVLRRR